MKMSSLIVTFAIHCAVNDDIKELLCISFVYQYYYLHLGDDIDVQKLLSM